VFLTDPFTFATPSTLRLLLRSGEVEVVYTGDRMWPGLRHGQRVRCQRVGDGLPSPGQVVLACPSGVPDLLRVVAADGDGVWLAGDADPGPHEHVARDAIVATTDLAPRHSGRWARRRRRLWIDFHEAVARRSDEADDLAESVRFKYDSQARFYAATAIQGMGAQLREHFRRHVLPGGTALVAGSGVGNECFALAEDGWRVKGLDFAPAMVEEARRRAGQRGIAVEFVLGDLRSHDEPEASLAAVLFTWEVYSFLPSAEARRDLLQRMSRWLRPGAVVYLSARVTTSIHERLLLELKRAWSPRAGWGASHTRWIDLDGRVRRSFVQIFTRRGLAREAEASGFGIEELHPGHLLLRPTIRQERATP
jgi:SAM-dependent methyltransferase